MKEEMAKATKKKGRGEESAERVLPRLRASISGSTSLCVQWDLPGGVAL